MADTPPEPNNGPISRRASVRRRVRRGRTHRWVWPLVGVLLVAGGVVAAWRLGWLDRAALRRVSLPLLQPAEGSEVTLYFGDPRWTRLLPEQRRFSGTGDAPAEIRALVEALAEGPRLGGAPVLPRGTKLRGAYLGKDGLAVVDFDPSLDDFDPGGASGEAITVFAVVQTLTENVPGVTSVQILVGGRERETLAGHVKISEPLRPDPQWTASKRTVAGSPGAAAPDRE